MKDFTLRAKSWLIFLPIIFPTLLSFYLQYQYRGWISDVQQSALSGADPFEMFDIDLSGYRTYFVGYLLIYCLAIFTQLGWYYSVGTGLRDHLPVGTELKEKRFRLALVISVVFAVLLLLGQYFLFEWLVDFAPVFFESISSGEEPDFGDPQQFVSRFLLIWGLVMLIGLLGFLAFAYLAYYAGKTVRCIEEQKPLRGSAVAGYAILSYFLFIGIWVLQPKINRLMETGEIAEPVKKPW